MSAGRGDNGPMTDDSRLPRALRPFSSGQYRLLVAALCRVAARRPGPGSSPPCGRSSSSAASPIDLSYVAVGASLGLVLAVLFGGVAADRIPQRRILLAVEIVRGVTFGVAAVLGATGVIEVWHLAVLSFVLGVADGFFYPAYSAWLPAILPPSSCSRPTASRACCGRRSCRPPVPRSRALLIAVQAPGLAFAVVAVAAGARRGRCSLVMRTTARAARSRRGRSASAPAVVRRHARRVRLHAAHAVAARRRCCSRSSSVLRHHGADRGAAAVRGEGPDRRRCRRVRARARRVRRRRRGRVARGRLAPAARGAT